MDTAKMTSGAAQTPTCKICGCLDIYNNHGVIIDEIKINGMSKRVMDFYLEVLLYRPRRACELEAIVNNHFPQWAGKLQKLILLK